MTIMQIDSANGAAIDDLRLSRSGRSVKIIAPIGTFSYYHPQQPFTGYGWDTQSASTLLLTRDPASILILGLGGGTVARQCRLMFPQAKIVGVDSDPRIVEMGYRNCDLGSSGVEVHVTTGSQFLRKNRQHFCAIIDDMWPPEHGGHKPIFCEPNWPRLIRSRLKPWGLYAVNLYSRRAHAGELKSAIRRLGPHFLEMRELRPGLGPTAVVAVGDELLTAKRAGARLAHLQNDCAEGLSHVKFLKVRAAEREA